MGTQRLAVVAQFARAEPVHEPIAATLLPPHHNRARGQELDISIETG